MESQRIQQPAYNNLQTLDIKIFTRTEIWQSTQYHSSLHGKEIKAWPQLKPVNGAAFQKLHSFLIKCESATYGQTWNALDTPEMTCLVLSKLPGHIRERCNRSVMSIQRRYSRNLTLQT